MKLQNLLCLESFLEIFETSEEILKLLETYIKSMTLPSDVPPGLGRDLEWILSEKNISGIYELQRPLELSQLHSMSQ